MGKPRLIIIIRHAQSEGNQNRQIHQTIPDHRVKLTPEGWEQAHDAGRRLRSMLLPSDTLQFYVSPYRRTRETTQAILDTLTSDTPEPSPFSNNAIKVWEEPRLREQDFGNFQPSAADMERMWKERADYGHFFYRIPNGESAADAYDRVSGFNESLWRSFGEDDFPSVCVLVTHGLMSRVFLMKWYHWSVEYFEDLRNTNHCEFLIMARNESGKFILHNQLRTWSELKRRAAAAERGEDPASVTSPWVPARKRWGAFSEGGDRGSNGDSLRVKRRDTKDPRAPLSSKEQSPTKPMASDATQRITNQAEPRTSADEAEDDEEAFPNPDDEDANRTKLDTDLQPIRSNTAAAFTERMKLDDRLRPFPSYKEAGRDFGGTSSGAPTPALEESSDRLEYIRPRPQKALDPELSTVPERTNDGSKDDNGSLGKAPIHISDRFDSARWREESGMGCGARADALGDQDTDDGEDNADTAHNGTASPD